jgi:hypothetical protein
MAKKTEIEDLKTQEAALERQLATVRVKRMALERTSRSSKESMRPLRDVVLDTLADANFPLNSLLLSSIVRPLYNRNIPSNRFGTLSNDEMKSYDSSRPRPLYLCHCMTYDNGHAVKRFWARSDWTLAARIMGPMSGRVLFLQGAAWIIALARSVEEGTRTADSLEILKYVAADQARDAGLPVKRGEFPYKEWLSVIDATLKRHIEADQVVREESAKTLQAKLSDRELLFGTTTGFVSLPGSSPTWRSAIE